MMISAEVSDMVVKVMPTILADGARVKEPLPSRSLSAKTSNVPTPVILTGELKVISPLAVIIILSPTTMPEAVAVISMSPPVVNRIHEEATATVSAAFIDMDNDVKSTSKEMSELVAEADMVVGIVDVEGVPEKEMRAPEASATKRREVEAN
jgi:hypothetical protein